MTDEILEQTCETSIIELARSVPKDYRAEWEIQWFDDGTPSGHAMAPVGRYLHDMADTLESLLADRDRWKKLASDQDDTQDILHTKNVELRKENKVLREVADHAGRMWCDPSWRKHSENLDKALAKWEKMNESEPQSTGA